MDRTSALNEIKKMEPDFLTPARKIVNGRQTYICPFCGNGSGDNGDGIAFTNGHYKCFVCGFYGDIVDLWKASQGIDDDLEAFNSLYAYYGIQVDNIKHDGARRPYNPPRRSMQSTAPANSMPWEEKNLMPYFRACMARINSTDYLHTRGLDDDIIKEFMLGYQPYYHTKNADTGEEETWKAIIIPTGKGTYTVRNTDAGASKDNRHRKSKGSGLYRKRALREADKPIFIVEGELDALSIIEAGGEAVGLGSTSHKSDLVKMLKAQKPSRMLILALDNDKEGERTSSELEADLTELNISYTRVSIYGDKKDANEALIADREGLKNSIEEVGKRCQ